MKIGNLEVYGVIYKITNLVNNKCYIGQTINQKGFNGRYGYSGIGIERVYKYHKHNKDKGNYKNTYLLNSIEKYGFENFAVDEYFDVAFSKDELNIKEQCWIAFYNSTNRNYGYNRNFGGNSGIPTEESRLLISLNHADLNEGKNPNAKKVICLNTREIFESVSVANKLYNIKGVNSIGQVCNNNRKYAGKLNNIPLSWMWYDDYINSSKDDIKKKIELANLFKDINKPKEIYIYDRNYNLIYEGKSITETSKWIYDNNYTNTYGNARDVIKKAKDKLYKGIYIVKLKELVQVI